MKRLRNIITGCILIMSLCRCATPAVAQTLTNDGAAPATVNVETESKQYTYLKIKLQMNLDSMRLKPKESRVLTPLLTDGTHSQALRSVTVNGTWRHLMYLRRIDARSKDALVVEASKRGTGTVEYTDSCLYAPWMKHATLWLAEDLCGCGGNVMEQSRRQLTNGRKDTDSTPDTLSAPDTLFVPVKISAPVKAAAKRKVAQVTLYLHTLSFPVNQMEILPAFGDNQKELQKLETVLDSLLALTNHRIEVVRMTGYASPEGPYLRNEKLAYGRTLALRDYMQSKAEYRELPFSTASVAEDWEGLKVTLENSDMPYKEELLMIIATHLPPDQKEENMKKLDGGRAYELLKQDFLVKLRRTVCEIHYIENQTTQRDNEKGSDR